MSAGYKTVRNGRGTCLEIGEESYLLVGKGGEEVMVRGKGLAAAFDSWEALLGALDMSRASYVGEV